MSFWDYISPTGKKNPIYKGAKSLFGSTPQKTEQISTLTPDQQQLHEQLLNAGMGEGAGGAFGDSSDYWRNLLSNNSQDFDAFAAPEMRRFNEDIIPGLAEQFAGMGSGNLQSSGFQNAASNAGVDLSERLGAIRANLRQGAASNLFNAGQAGLNPVTENIINPADPGFLHQAAPALGTAAGAALGSFLGPAGTAAGAALGNQFGSQFGNSNQRSLVSNKGSAQPYGGKSNMFQNNMNMQPGNLRSQASQVGGFL